ncbi:MAG: site-2 protease family protein [Candidatus Krumholzibacteriia bacterium]
MFGKRVTLFRILGFDIRVDASWLLIAFLVTWLLSTSFRHEYGDLGTGTILLMALSGMLGLFVSVVLHELSHSIVARMHGMEMRGITLFLFGGVAEMGEEPPTARAEFRMAIVGPFCSYVLAGVFWLLTRWSDSAGLGTPVVGVLKYLTLINLVLATFNLLPGFPLDGGRILRAVLWGWRKNLRWATRVASTIGGLVGLGLIVLGVGTAIGGNYVGGAWSTLIGMFLRTAARSSYKQMLAHRVLEEAPVGRLMQTNPVTVPPDISLEQLVELYLYRHTFKMFPVVDDSGVLRGCIAISRLKDVPRDQWGTRRVGEYVEPCSASNSLNPAAHALAALQLMNRRRTSRLLIVDQGALVGVLSLKDLLSFLSRSVRR